MININKWLVCIYTLMVCYGLIVMICRAHVVEENRIKIFLFKHLMRRNYLARYNKIQLRKMGCWLNSTASGQTSVTKFWANGNRCVGFHNSRQNLQLDGWLLIFLRRTRTMESAVSATSSLSWASTVYTFPNMFIGLTHFNSVQILILQMTHQQW